MKEKEVKKMITIKMRADSLVFKDVTPAVKRDIVERCEGVTTASYTPYLYETKGKDIIITSDHSDLYGLIYSLSFKYDIEIV